MEMERIWKLFIAQCEGDAPANHRVSKTPTMRLTSSKAKPARLGQNTSNQDYKKAFSFSMPTSKLMHTCADSHRAKSRFNKKKQRLDWGFHLNFHYGKCFCCFSITLQVVEVFLDQQKTFPEDMQLRWNSKWFSFSLSVRFALDPNEWNRDDEGENEE